MLNVNVKILRKNGVIPVYKNESNGADCYSTISDVIEPGGKLMVPLGFAMELPEGYCALLIPRSSLATKQRLTLANSPGLIDTDYRGEVCACIVNEGNEPQIINEGDRVCQLLILETPKVSFNSVEELSDTERGTGGFGSTGRN